jgi:hypothetical protein
LARSNGLAKAPDAMPILERVLSRVTAPAVRRVDPALEASPPLPAKDRPVLAAAIPDACDARVTGDRSHFGSLYGRTIHGVAIHSPRSLAAALLR